MASVTVPQFIFTRVETTYSPKYSGGYQMVYASKALTGTEVNDIRARVQCYVPASLEAEERVRLQYFQIPSTQKVVVAQTSVLEGDTTFLDRTGRRGVFLVHGFVFSQAEFAQFENNPFAIWNGNFDFIATKEALWNCIEQFGKATGIAPLAEGSSAYTRRAEWEGAIGKVVEHARNAISLRGQGQAVLFYGNQLTIQTSFESVFAILRPNERLECPFDTYIDGCATPMGFFWGVGAGRRMTGKYIEINVNEIQFTLNESVESHQEITPPEKIEFSHEVPLPEQATDTGEAQMETTTTERATPSEATPQAQSIQPATSETSHSKNNQLPIEKPQTAQEIFKKNFIKSLTPYMDHNPRLVRYIYEYIIEQRWLDPKKDYANEIKKLKLADDDIAYRVSIWIEDWISGYINLIQSKHFELDSNDWDSLVRLSTNVGNKVLQFWSLCLRESLCGTEIEDNVLPKVVNSENFYKESRFEKAMKLQNTYIPTYRYVYLRMNDINKNKLLENNKYDSLGDKLMYKLVTTMLQKDISPVHPKMLEKIKSYLSYSTYKEWFQQVLDTINSRRGFWHSNNTYHEFEAFIQLIEEGAKQHKET